jgi:hypothetical protein
VGGLPRDLGQRLDLALARAEPDHRPPHPIALVDRGELAGDGQRAGRSDLIGRGALGGQPEALDPLDQLGREPIGDLASDLELVLGVDALVTSRPSRAKSPRLRLTCSGEIAKS